MQDSNLGAILFQIFHLGFCR